MALTFKHTVSSVSTPVLWSQVIDQDQYDLHYAHTFFILDEAVYSRGASVPQTVQHLLHGEVLLSAYFPMPCPDGDMEMLDQLL